MSVEPQAAGWLGSTAARSRPARVRSRGRMRPWLWAWVLWLLVAAAAPPVGLVVGVALAVAHKALGAVMITVATISAIWIGAAYFSR